jgi:hypothetical protein
MNGVRLEVKGMRAVVRVNLMVVGIIGVRLLGGMVGWKSLGLLSVCLLSLVRSRREKGADVDRRDWSIELIDYAAEVYH